MASWLLLPFSSFPWPTPPPPDSSSCRGSDNDGGGDSGYWRLTVVVAFAGAQVGCALRRRFADLLRSPEVRHLDALTKMGSFWFEGSELFTTFHILAAIGHVFSAPYVCSSALFSGNGSGGRYISNEKLLSRQPRGINSKKRL
ncbi:uncharacterized protein [Zea mays]|uniref:Uncharacterized protein n=1 Tax=Zea mays TaxID=4577 RepID=A0A1D6QI82_MAIZE|nr:uncharacterized protein LOC109946036 [Zea mays]AQK57570.1 hypothetical protein ZEAMMB73_Zm00001d052649 [Zea mays]AQK57571.1 hypothetical protein ZEAMMB73_Zm00001d052649 [Zea mays]|eukprot:XP_020408187.1 uncharacterized protein LOC109946036 [Zea mays]